MASPSGTLFAFLAGLALVFVTAHGLGLLADRIGFVPVVGELLTGILLGPTVLVVLAPTVAALVVPVPDQLGAFASLGLVLLLVLAGIEVDVSLVRRSIRPTVALATGAFVVPFAAGFAVAWVLPDAVVVDPVDRLPFALFLATALSISAVPVAVRVLVDLDAMDRTVGQLTLTTAVVVDAAGWVALTVVTDVAVGGPTNLAGVARTVLVLAAFVVVSALAVPRFVRPLFAAVDRVRSPTVTGLALVVSVGVGMAAAALALGLEAVLGAFLAGVLVREAIDAETADAFQVVTLSLFAPLFFATAGLRADLSALLEPNALAVAALVLVAAVAGKVLGVAAAAPFTDLDRNETLCLAIGLNARGAMEIVVAAVGLAAGILTPIVYAVIVLVAILTSVATPPLLRRALRRLPAHSSAA